MQSLAPEDALSPKPDTMRYEWDAEDRLIGMTTPDGTRWRYQVRPSWCRTARLRLAEDGETAHGAVVPLCVHGQTDPALGE
ncbi:YD repeat-containing protein [Streptomyces sp. Ag82_O1-12]|nr:YD repeat-containing protein [Streptomyces sp. Ag82_O1-12]SOD49522.1 YD repeat-containing protein [Streptomyces sp. Ag82_G6-1]